MVFSKLGVKEIRKKHKNVWLTSGYGNQNFMQHLRGKLNVYKNYRTCPAFWEITLVAI